MTTGVIAPSVDAQPSLEHPATPVDPYARATALLAQLCVFVAGYELDIGVGASAALPLAVVLLPLWIRTLSRYTLARTVAVLGILSVVAGVILSELAAFDHAVSTAVRRQSIGLLLSGIAVFALILWARSLLPIHRVVMLYGAGGVAGALLASHVSWKYDLAVPVTFLVLGVLERGTSRLVPAIAVVGLGVLGIMDDGRSFFALCILAAALTVWQMSSRDRGLAASRWFPVMIMGAVAVVIYLLTTALLSGGYLGSESEERSNVQIEKTGSVLAGGRPEWAATRELFLLRPIGYGAGVVPSWADVQAAKAGLSELNIELENQRRQYMFGGQFKLHGVAPDLWISYGWMGIALAVVMLIGLVRSLSFSIAARTAPTSVILAASLAVWFMLFGPISSNWPGVCAGLALVLTPAGTRRPART
jgi:hypothetical protein